MFAEAITALAELLSDEEHDGPGVARRVEAQASDRPALLAAWLEELVFLAETEGFEPEALEEIELGPQSVETTVVGRRGAPPPLVKAVTYHRLTFGPASGGYRASVVFDV